MSANNSFNFLASLLKRELQSQGMSQAQLAEGLTIEGIEASTINRNIRNIIKGQRLPPKRDWDLYLDHFHFRLDILLEELEEAYGKDIEQMKHKPNVAEKLEILIPYSAQNTRDIKLSIDILRQHNKHQQTIALIGKQNLIHAMIALLESLEEVENEQSNIYLTFQGRKSIFFAEHKDEKEIEKKWRSAIESAIKKGYNFIHLIRMGSNQRRIEDIVLRIVSLISEQKGIYELRTLRDDFILQPPYGIFLVPFPSYTQGVITLSTYDSEMTDSGILTNDKEIINIMEKHIKMLEKESKQVFQRFDDYSAMFDKIAEADRKPGERYIFLKRLSEITRPLEWYNPKSNWAIQLCDYLELKTDEEREKHIALRRKRRLYLEEHLKKNSCFYIYKKSLFINSLIINKDRHNNSKLRHYFTPNDQEIIQQLESILILLGTKNFNIALLEDDEILQSNFDKIKLDYCEVINQNLVIMEVPVNVDDQVKYQKRWCLTQNTIVARSFQTYFASLWDIIPESSRNTNEIYEYLDALKKEI